ncbi:ADP-ribosylglycohydrolase family protein [Hydrogenimonas thermophila]|uniref:ADP-ribosylglycohydrolase family protein n=1 Tax=Hydrogenimonas thermophila TaxID=223786 RepID=UPI002936E9A3|nr:ADP-ribosylglycohydrolase family protein [Hydrogenimonas thermophila]WOE71045.1 ADP-ribosylglycohydrolase family protein [Hydrogenimonas thermophila]WOE73563.1 ADP-ribosylglycohydrolase family protein [Hydrogenimonas thermophila]
MINRSLLALACGDSYGSHYEMDGLMGDRFSIRKLPNKPKFPNITDDTKMATILLKHYHKYKKLEVDILRDEYKKWAINDGFKDGIGIHTNEVLVEGKSDKDSQGNGALMRNIPFGLQLIDDGYSFEEAVELMNLDSAITHENETIFLANALALDLAINGLKALEKSEYKKLCNKLHYGQTAWVIHSLHIVIDAMKKRKRKFITAFKYIVSQGGDTDTNCAIYGAIMGYKKDITKEIDVKEFLPNDQIKQEGVKC